MAVLTSDLRKQAVTLLHSLRHQIGFGVNVVKGSSFYLKVFGGREGEPRKRNQQILEFPVSKCTPEQLFCFFVSSLQVAMTKQY